MRKWICYLCIACVLVVVLQAAAQIPAPGPEQEVVVDTEKKEEYVRLKADIGASLEDIARRTTQHTQNPSVDIVFVIDGSKRMIPHLATLEKRIVDMLAVIEVKTIDYRFALVGFHSLQTGPRVALHKWTFDYFGISKALREMRVSSGNNVFPGHGLDAIMEGLNELRFREEATTQFVVITNERMRTSYTDARAKKRITERIINLSRRNNVQLNFIGLSEEVQGKLTDATNGKWYPINSKQRPMDGERIQVGEIIADKALLRVDGLFKRIAEDLVKNNPGKVDVVFIFDYSKSMETKTDAACDGLDLMVSVFKEAGLDYRFGMIRFWAPVSGGESVVVVTKPPLKPRQVKVLFRLPKVGDEHLLDAVIQGVPKLRTNVERNLILIIVTDESTSKRTEKGYTVGQAISVCRGARARVYVIGGVTSMTRGSIVDTFQRQVAQLTKGQHYIMPGSIIADERR